MKVGIIAFFVSFLVLLGITALGASGPIIEQGFENWWRKESPDVAVVIGFILFISVFCGVIAAGVAEED